MTPEERTREPYRAAVLDKTRERDRTTLQLIGRLCLYKSRCEAEHRAGYHGREPGRIALVMVADGHLTARALMEAVSPDDWEWFKRFYRELGAFKP